MRTVLNSFPILWSIWNGPSAPPPPLLPPSFPSALAFAPCRRCQWHNLKLLAPLHLPAHTFCRDLSAIQVPGLCLFL